MKKLLLTTVLVLASLFAAATLFFTVRQSMANRAIEIEWQTRPTVTPALATTSQLEIIPLYEEASLNPDLISGHGVSYLIRTDAATILMDVGHNPDELDIAPFMQNMQNLGIDWEEIDRIVISHPHPDHVGGMAAWRQHTVSFGELPGGIGERMVFVPSDMAFQGAIHATIPTLPSSDVATTGVISYPEVFPLSLFNPRGEEQALVVNVGGEGLVLITGCGHPTIEKLIARAEDLYNLPVIGIVGGLHYEGFTFDDVQPHIQFLASRDLKLVAVSPHDSSPEAHQAFRSTFGSRYQLLQVGESILFP
jgi:7,8-dihydropterin-6-yl-methyl-4-(beta-D-ribofuranosyl)aminobenzene 5'-phosphate synthase